MLLRSRHWALTRGPLVYATGLVDGYKLEETLCLPDAPLVDWLGEVPGDPPALELRPLHRSPLRYEPWALAGGRADGSWRLAWMPLAPAGAAQAKNL